MNILFHLTAPPPPVPGTDAVVQELEALRARFGGALLPLYPLRRPSRWFPKPLYGLHQLRALRRLEPTCDLHHFSFGTLYPFPWLRRLRQPLVYAVSAGLGAVPGARRPRWLDGVRAVVSPSPRDEPLLRDWCGARGHMIRPGIPVERFTPTPLALRDELVLLVGSAPWIPSQFRSKGIDLLLEAARSLPLRLVFLWRGLLLDALRRRVAARGLGRQVEIVDGFTDVNRVLAGVHAAVVLAASGRLVKAWPHSLMESLAAGKPVLLSACIPMADYVADAGCGEVVEALALRALAAALRRLMDRYAARQAAARARGPSDLALGPMLDAYGRVYAGLA